MMKSRSKNSNILNPILILLLISCGSESINAQEVEDEREFEYAEKSEKGPRKWGRLKKEWIACSNGDMQSPINLSKHKLIIIPKKELNIKYRPSNATLNNRGHDIQIQWLGDAGSISINGTHYPLRQAHWHSPSEHTINGISFDMELHLVHLSTNPNLKNKIAVVGLLYKIGNKPDKFLSKLERNLSSMIDKKHEEKRVGIIDPADIKLHSKRYYRYMGSLTIPPCTQGVIWTINNKVKNVSREQIKLLREAVHDFAEKNARPLQARNDRDILLYGPTQKS